MFYINSNTGGELVPSGVVSSDEPQCLLITPSFPSLCHWSLFSFSNLKNISHFIFYLKMLQTVNQLTRNTFQRWRHFDKERMKSQNWIQLLTGWPQPHAHHPDPRSRLRKDHHYEVEIMIRTALSLYIKTWLVAEFPHQISHNET